MMDRLQPQEPAGGEKPSDLDKVVTSVKEHPLRYAAGFLLVIAAGVGFLFYSTSVQARSEAAATTLIRATNVEEPEERISKLDAAIESGTPLAAEALYLKAENAFAIEDYEAAKAAFEAVVTRFPDFQFAPDALEGLGYVEEAQGNYEAAVTHYLDVQIKYPDSYAARRQPYNLGRAYAAQGMVKEAVESYWRQVGEFPDSAIAARAQRRVEEYRGTHPELFQQFEQMFTEDEPEATEDVDLVVVPEEGTAAPAPETFESLGNAGGPVEAEPAEPEAAGTEQQ